MADGLLGKLAEQHGYIVVSPLGFTPLGAYGNPLRLPAVFGESETAAAQRAAVTPERRRELDLSELEVITALEIVTEEYGADRSRTFLAGHSMGSGGVWHLAARYPERWRAVAPMSGPFIDKESYPFDRIRASADLRDGRHGRRAVARRQPGARGVHARGRLRLRVPRGRRQPRQHGADGLARDLRVLRSRLCARRRTINNENAPYAARYVRRRRTVLGHAGARSNGAPPLAGRSARLGALVDTGVDHEIALRRSRHHERQRSDR